MKFIKLTIVAMGSLQLAGAAICHPFGALGSPYTNICRATVGNEYLAEPNSGCTTSSSSCSWSNSASKIDCSVSANLLTPITLSPSTFT